MTYQPSQQILDKYADVLVNFALNKGNGVKKGEVVFLQVPESAKPLLISLNKAVLKSGAHPIIQYIPDNFSRDFFELASSEQINFFPRHYLKGRVRQADHFIMVLAETDLHELEGIDPLKIMDRNKSLKPYKNWRDKKEEQEKLSWVIASYGTQAMAKEANLTLEECWNQIIKACFLDEENPVQKWKDVYKEIEKIRNKLDNLDIKQLHVKSKNTDLFVGIGKNRKWVSGRGCNIPSFEIFTSPDYHQTEGYVTFDQPLYRYGNLIKDIYLEFKKGKIIKATAKSGENVLKEMIKVKNADQIGEFSLTDKRMSRINKFMAETLYDENFGGKYGNMHLAVGSSFKEAFNGDFKKISKKQFKEMGFNDCVIHADIISTEDRVVTAILNNGQEKIIYEDGQFVI